MIEDGPTPTGPQLFLCAVSAGHWAGRGAVDNPSSATTAPLHIITAIPADRTRLSFTVQAGLASTAWFALSRWGEPAASRQGGPQQQLVDRQAGLDVTGLLDGALNYAIILRTIVLNIIAVSLTKVQRPESESTDLCGQRKIFIFTQLFQSASFASFWLLMSLLPERETAAAKQEAVGTSFICDNCDTLGKRQGRVGESGESWREQLAGQARTVQW